MPSIRICSDLIRLRQLMHLSRPKNWFVFNPLVIHVLKRPPDLVRWMKYVSCPKVGWPIHVYRILWLFMVKVVSVWYFLDLWIWASNTEYSMQYMYQIREIFTISVHFFDKDLYNLLIIVTRSGMFILKYIVQKLRYKILWMGISRQNCTFSRKVATYRMFGFFNDNGNMFHYLI